MICHHPSELLLPSTFHPHDDVFGWLLYCANIMHQLSFMSSNQVNPANARNLKKFEIFAKYCHAVPCIDVISEILRAEQTR